jgi:sporulation protein YlmC with PRC-barrel domain
MSSDKSSATPSATPAPSTTGAASASTATITAQKPDQLLVSNLKGVDVMGSDDKKVGDISDLLFTKDGKVDAILISVGGFLGVGAKEIALPPNQIQLHEENGSWKAKVSMNKDQLKDAPNFERHKETKTSTTGSGMGSSSKSSTAPRNAPSGTPPK